MKPYEVDAKLAETPSDAGSVSFGREIGTEGQVDTKEAYTVTRFGFSIRVRASVFLMVFASSFDLFILLGAAKVAATHHEPVSQFQGMIEETEVWRTAQGVLIDRKLEKSGLAE
jgi:hypothetical protein